MRYRRVRRTLSFVAAASLAATFVAVTPRPAAAVDPPQAWRSPCCVDTGTGNPKPFSQPSRQLVPNFAANMLSTNGQWATFLNMGSMDIGTGIVFAHNLGSNTSGFRSSWSSKEVQGGPHPFGVRGEIANNGVQALTYVNTATSLEVASTYQGWTYPQTLSDVSDDMSLGTDDSGRWVLWGKNLQALNENGTPEDPNDDYLVGGYLYRMDGAAQGTGGIHARKDSLIASNVTSAVMNSTVTTIDTQRSKHSIYWTEISGTHPNQTQKLRSREITTRTYYVWGILTIEHTQSTPVDIALPAPFDATPYPNGLSLNVMDVSPNGRYLAFGILDESGTIDGGAVHYYVRDNTTGAVVEPPVAPAGEDPYIPTSIGNDGTYGVSQNVTSTTPIPPKVVKLNGEVWPVGPAEDRLTSGAGNQYTAISGDGAVVSYFTANAVNAFDTNGLDDLVSVNMADVSPPSSGHLPTANGGLDRTVAEGSSVTLNASASSSNDQGQPLLSYRFDRGRDGTIDQQGTSPTYTFNAPDGPGSVEVGVTVTDPDGTSPEDVVTVTTTNAPPAINQADVNPRTGTAGVTQFQFTTQSITDPGGDPVTVEWDFDGDGTYDYTGATPPPHVYPASGTFTPKVRASDDDGGSTVANVPTVTVSAGGGGTLPTADAGQDQTVAEGASVTVDASASSTNDTGQTISEYRFDRGNDGTVEQQGASATYTFAAPDGPSATPVAVTVVDPDGTSAPDVATITSTNVAPAVSGSGVNPTSGVAGTTAFSYTAGVVTDAGGDPVTLSWDFDGNGTTDATGAVPAPYTFPLLGTYNGKLTASDDDGGSTVVNLATVTVAGRPPTADAGPDKSASEGSSVTVSASASSANDPGQTISEYRFDLGRDGTVDQQGASASFSFTAPDGPAIVEVGLTVVDPDATSAEDVAVVTVNNAAPAVSGANVTPGVGTAGVTSFTYSITSVGDPGGDPVTLSWDFDGNGTTDATGQTPAPHTFAAAGTYNGKLTASDDDGGSTVVNLPVVTVVGTGGGGPDDDDDGDGIRNKFDGAPSDPTLTRLTTLCGSGTYPGTNTADATVGGCLTFNTFWRLLLGSFRLADGSVRFDGSWFFASGKTKTAPNVAYYKGRSLSGFSWTKGFLWTNYEIAVFDNGPSGDRIVAEVRGPSSVTYYTNQTLTTGNFTVT